MILLRSKVQVDKGPPSATTPFRTWLLANVRMFHNDFRAIRALSY
jgi:hypothetical protein